VPRLWTDTIEGHRHAVREATLDAAAALIAERGLAGVTMSQVAEATGIGRATLYKYFPDIHSVLVAWHERQIARHLQHLTEVRDGAGSAGERLTAVLQAYARLAHQPHGTDVAAALHQGAHVAQARSQLSDFLRDLLAEGAASGELRDDVPVEELVSYCLHALSAAREMPSEEAVRRLVAITSAGLRPQRRVAPDGPHHPTSCGRGTDR
jgi:AcrR family transcriptional regulator